MERRALPSTLVVACLTLVNAPAFGQEFHAIDVTPPYQELLMNTVTHVWRRDRIRMLSDRLLFTRDSGTQDCLRAQLQDEISQARMLEGAVTSGTPRAPHHLGS